MNKKENFFKKIKTEDFGSAYRNFTEGKYPPHIFSLISLTRLSFIIEKESDINKELKKSNYSIDFINILDEDFFDFLIIKNFIENSNKILFPENILEIIERVENLLKENEIILSSFQS